MATYTVKTFNKSKVSMKINETDERWFVSLPFTVVELNYSDNILLREDDFSLQNAKVQLIEKIKVEVVRLAEHKEYQIEV